MTQNVSPAQGFFICHTCKLRHPCINNQNYLDKLAQHVGHSTSYLDRDWLNEHGHSKLAAWNPLKKLVSAIGFWDVLKLRMAIEGYTPNADVKAALQTLQSLTVTNLHSLASSATAGWQSAEIDNTANLYLDALAQFVLDFANTAPGSSKGCYVFAGAGIETGKLSNPMSGAEGTLTLLDVTNNPQTPRQIGFIPYTTQDEVVESSPMSVAAGFNGVLPPFWALAFINHSGAALAAAGNTAKYRGVYATVI